MKRLLRVGSELSLACGSVLVLLLGGGADARDVPFAPQAVISTAGRVANDAVAADVDGDGDLDVLSGSAIDDTIRWFENDGTPGALSDWTTHTVSSAALDVVSVSVADLDADGDLDVVYASDQDHRIEWIENTAGDGSGWSSHRISVLPRRGQSVFVADVDGDGDPDVLSASLEDDRIAWYENDGSPGTPEDWLAHDVSTLVDGAVSVAAADVDADGDLDVLSTSLFPAALDTVSWHENTAGDGSAWIKHPIATRAGGARSVSAADLDRDGDVDVLIASEASDRITWYENDGSPRDPVEWAGHDVATAEDGVRAVIPVDLDADGDLDVASASSFGGNRVAWHENTASDASVWTPHAISTDLVGGTAVAVGDLDRDGDPDVVSASRNDDKVAWYENLTLHGSAIYPHRESVSTLADAARTVHPADVDGDGDLDLLSASRLDDTVAWFERNPGGTPAWIRHPVSTTEDGAFSVTAVDLDQDGDLDALSASIDDDTVAWHENTAADGSAWTPHPITTAADGAIAVAAADIDRDGDPDVLSASIWDDTIAWHENASGDGLSWIAHPITAGADGAAFVAAADLDGDGDGDVLSASLLDDTVAWYENTGGDGSSWSPHTISSGADGVESVCATDVDADGDLDVLAASFNDDSVRWYENTLGDASTWAPHLISAAADGANGIFAADLDADGDVDVLSASLEDDKIAWYENRAGDGSLWTERGISTLADGAVFVVSADLDADGDLDVASASTSDDTIAWYENRGGQFALITQDTAPTELSSGEIDDVLRIEVSHRGRSGDGALELAALDLGLEDGSGVPFTSAEANALIASVRVYVDDGSEVFESGVDALVASVAPLALSSGAVTIGLPDGDPRLAVAAGATLTTFVVTELAAGASQATPNRFRVTHVTEATSRAEDVDHDTDLRLEYAPNVSSGVVTAHGLACSDGLDNDGDGLADHPADPGCDSPSDVSERSPSLVCDDGADNDGDGRADFVADRGCSDPRDGSEESDRDADGFVDPLDNCVEFANTNQWDSNGDGLGNACDADLNDDGFVDADDLDILRARIFTTDADADLDGDGIVDYDDLAQMKRLHLRTPGLSGVLSSPPTLSNLQLSAAVFPVPQEGQRLPLTITFDYADADADLAQLIFELAGPQGTVFRLLDDFTPGDAGGTAARQLSLDATFGPGSYTVTLQLVDAVENAGNVAVAGFTVDGSALPPIEIASVSPASGQPGDGVQISGRGFTSVSEDELRVSFAGAGRSAEISFVVFDELNVVVPEGAVTGPILLETPLGMFPSPAPFVVTPTVTVSPAVHQMLRGETVALECRLSGTSSKRVTWSIASGSDPALGTLDAFGVYTAPTALPPTNPVFARCTAQDDPLLFADAEIEILPPVSEPGLGSILLAAGGELFTEDRQVVVEIAPNALAADTDFAIQLPPAAGLPAVGSGSVVAASVELSPAGVSFATPAQATFALRHWMAPGTTLPVFRVDAAPGARAAVAAAGTPVSMAAVDSTGVAATASLATTGTFYVEAALKTDKTLAESILGNLLDQSHGFELVRPRNTEWLEGLVVPIVIQSQATPPREVGPFFEGVEIEASLDGYGPIPVGPRVQPDATGWKVGTLLRLPVLTDCGVGQSRRGSVTVRYPEPVGSTAELVLAFQIACLDELIFASGQPPSPMPPLSVWSQEGTAGVLRMRPNTPHRFSQVEIGSGGRLAPFEEATFTGPLVLEATKDIRVSGGGAIAMEKFDVDRNPRLHQDEDGHSWQSTGFLDLGIAGGKGGTGSAWHGTDGGKGGGGSSSDGSAGSAATIGGGGGAGGEWWEFADWFSAVTSGASLVVSVVTEDWIGAALDAYELGEDVVLISQVDANRIKGTGRGGRAAGRAQWSLVDPPQAGGAGGGSGKMVHDCSFIFDFCPDEGGQGGGGGGGGAHPLNVHAGGGVYVDPGAAITGLGGPGGWGGTEIGGAPGGGGAGGNGAFIHVAASWLFNQGTLSAAGGKTGLSVACECPDGLGCLHYERVCTGDSYLISAGIGERGRDGVFRIDAGFTGQLPEKSSYDITGSPGDPWGQHYDFPFPGLGDSDGDGLKDGLENWIGTRSDQVDTDLDGLDDYQEAIDFGTDPTLRDTDGDTVLDGDEVAANPWVTDPLLPDTDGDGHDDGLEIAKGSDPTNRDSVPEICDGADNDLDGATDEDCEIRLDHKGTEFFVPFLPTLSGTPDPMLTLLITSDGFADVTVEYPVGTVRATVRVTPDGPQEVTIPAGAATGWQAWNPRFAVPIASNVARVSATFEVTVVAQNQKTFVADRALALPLELLGQEYRVMSWGGVILGATQAEFVVVATEDQTAVNVDGLPFPGGPLAVTLDRGQGFLVQSGIGLQGTRIVADKKVVVANGNDCVQIGGKYCEHLYEIALPVERWGTDYLARSNRSEILQRGYGLERNYYRVLVAQDDTELRVNGTLIGSFLAAGAVVDLSPESSVYRFDNHFSANKPIFVAQFMSSVCDEWPSDQTCSNPNSFENTVPGDASMTNLVPTGRFPKTVRFTGVGCDSWTTGLNVIAPTQDAQNESVLIDGNAISAFDFTAFPSAPAWSVATLDVRPDFSAGCNDLHVATSPNGHSLTLIGMGFNSAVTDPLGYDYDQ